MEKGRDPGILALIRAPISVLEMDVNQVVASLRRGVEVAPGQFWSPLVGSAGRRALLLPTTLTAGRRAGREAGLAGLRTDPQGRPSPCSEASPVG